MHKSVIRCFATRYVRNLAQPQAIHTMPKGNAKQVGGVPRVPRSRRLAYFELPATALMHGVQLDSQNARR